LLLSRALGERGHRVLAAVKNFDMPGGVTGMEVLAAPEWPAGVSRPGPAVSYAEILARRGYCLPGRLTRMLRRWLDVLERASPDLVLADHAPTALLACRIAGVMGCRVGTGFQAPPATTPYPFLLAEDRRDEERLKIEQLVLNAVNGSLAELGAEPAANLPEALATRRDFLCTFREFDHYPGRRVTDYLGPLHAPAECAPPQAYAEAAPGIVCYVSRTMPGFAELCVAFGRLGPDVLLDARGLSRAEARELSTGRLRVVERPIHLTQAAARSGLAITHGGHGATAAVLLAGCPVLVLPQQVEQLMFARRLE
jgi:UDP:flavonoid glycosyltransferase YjiC (YdhE family)